MVELSGIVGWRGREDERVAGSESLLSTESEIRCRKTVRIRVSALRPSFSGAVQQRVTNQLLTTNQRLAPQKGGGTLICGGWGS